MFKKIVLATTFVAVASVLFWATRARMTQETELRTLRQRNTLWASELERLNAENKQLAAEARLVTGTANLETATDDKSAIDSSARAWSARLTFMRQWLAQHPAESIPELRELPEREWLRIARIAQFDTDEHRRKSLALLRDAAKERFAERLASAMRKYLTAHNGEIPPTVQELAAYFVQPPDPAALTRYEMLRTGNVANLPKRTVAVIREKAPIDEEYDSQYGVDGNGVRRGGGGGSPYAWLSDPDGYDGMVKKAQAAFEQANHGVKTSSLEQLAPYITPPLPPAKLQKLIELQKSNRD